jgi:hypothetical protein
MLGVEILPAKVHTVVEYMSDNFHRYQVSCIILHIVNGSIFVEKSEWV